MARQLTEKQQKFLDVLFEEAQGDPAKAKRLAGYAETMPSTTVTNALQEEIAELTRKYIATRGSKAIFAVMNIMDDPTQLGSKERLAAAKDILDRAGFKATEKVEVKAETPLFILPPKDGRTPSTD